MILVTFYNVLPQVLVRGGVPINRLYNEKKNKKSPLRTEIIILPWTLRYRNYYYNVMRLQITHVYMCEKSHHVNRVTLVYVTSVRYTALYLY